MVSKDPQIIEQVKVLRNYGSDYRYHNIVEGYNDRLDELQAGLLRVKVKHMPELLANRNHIAERYIAEIDNIRVQLPKISEGCKHTWYQFVVRVNNQEKFRDHLKDLEIGSDIAWKTPPYLQPALDRLGYKKGDFPITEEICNTIVSLPMMDYMSEEEISAVIKGVNSYEG